MKKRTVKHYCAPPPIERNVIEWKAANFDHYPFKYCVYSVSSDRLDIRDRVETHEKLNDTFGTGSILQFPKGILDITNKDWQGVWLITYTGSSIFFKYEEDRTLWFLITSSERN